MKKYLKIFLIIFFLSLSFVNITKAVGEKKIGEKCYINSQCKTSNCEDGFCVCNTSNDCASTYGQNSDVWTCRWSSDDNSFGLNYCEHDNGSKQYPLKTGLEIGQICYDDADDTCISGDCEESKIKSTTENDPDWHKASGRDNVWYCDCDEDSDCGIYGPGDWECKDGSETSADIDYCKNKKTNKIEFPFEPYNTSLWGGLVDAVLDSEAYVEAFGENLDENLRKPQTKINIPGLEFSDPTAEENLEIDDEGNTYINIPFLGEFVSGIYKYLIVFASIVSIIVIIISGIQWIISAGNTEVIGSAKKRIMGAIIGLVLILSSYTILYTINPYLVEFKNLKILFIRQTLYDAMPENEMIVYTKSTIKIPTDPNGDSFTTYSINKPTWTINTFDCQTWDKQGYNAYEKPGLIGELITYNCGNNLVDPSNFNPISVTTIPEMKEPLCKAAAKAKSMGYQMVVTQGYRTFEKQVDLWCKTGAKEYSDPVVRRKNYALPGFSAHGLGVAIDVLLYKNGKPVTLGNRTIPGKTQCDTEEKYIKDLHKIFFDTSKYFHRLNSEIWHFEYTYEPYNSSRISKGSTMTYPPSCNK